MPKTAPQTLYDKIFEDHVVSRQSDGTCILYIDRHLVHEVTSPQAFEGLRLAGRKVRAPEKTLAVVDHNIATTADRNQGIKDEESRIQVETMAMNAKDFGIEYYDERDVRQGIVHVIGPEQGFTLPGTTIVCGDSHTSTHGAFGALAHGIGTQRGRARAGHPDADPAQGQEHARHRRAPRSASAPSSASTRARRRADQSPSSWTASTISTPASRSAVASTLPTSSSPSRTGIAQ